MNIWIVDDNQDCRESWIEIIEDIAPDARVTEFDSFHSVVLAGKTCPDVMLIDIWAVCGSQFCQFLDHVSWYMDKYPGCLFIIASALGKIAQQYVVDYSGDAVVKVIHVFDGECLKDILKTISSEVSNG